MFGLTTSRKSIRTIAMLSLLIGLVLGLASSVSADHLSNSQAELTGDGISGQAIVNYVKGTQGWSSTARVDGLAPGEYAFAVNANGGAPTIVCTFTADGNGSDGCSDQETAIPGFNTALILDSHGMIVASGMFERHGGNRNQ